VLGPSVLGTWRAAAALVLFLCWAGRAAAVPPAPADLPTPTPAPGEPFRLEYWAEGHCPDAIEFARQIQTRAPLLRPAQGDEPALGFYAELAERAGSATGRLTARTPDGREVTREVRGATCDDVVTALALIAALAADPDQPVAVPATRPARVPAARSIRRAPADDSALEATLPPDPAQRWTFGVGGGLSFDSSVAPSPGYGLGVEFDAESKGGSAWRPLFGLSAIRAAAPSTETNTGTASFTYLAFRGTVCPLRWPEETPLFFRPCLFFDAGVLEGNVASETSSEDKSQSWFASGAFGRVEALVDEVVSFQLDGGVTTALKRDSFRAGPGEPSTFQVPAAGVLGRIGLTYRFQ
jgi:hypothetical protein